MYIFIFSKDRIKYLITIVASSHIKNAPIVASSWLSCISILITCTTLLSTGVLDSKSKN